MMMASQRAMPPLAPHDTSDIDRYINYDQVAIPSPSRSPASLASKFTSTPITPQEFSSTPFTPIQPSSQQTFAAPSHQYGAYPQNNGLPVGALADTIAINRADQLSSSRNQHFYGHSMSDDFGMTPADDLDFGLGSNYAGSYNDMDLDFSTPPQNGLKQSADVDFVDPSAIGGQEATTPPSQSQAPRRAYPGMHQQQAALAKAQAEAQQKQREAAAQQQKKAAASHGRTGRSSADPVVEERISRLLDQMRHSSVTSSNDDDTVTHGHGSSNHGRPRKDEEDMDEDERLLASEEGKKLSSKERRQLRNKVSARAFRSRRKGKIAQSTEDIIFANDGTEYIGQLEGEITTKTAEADDLRVKNQELMKENAQLQSLTRTLLSSPAFSEFLNEMGGMSNTAASSAPAQSSVVKTESAEPVVPKDTNPNRVSHQQVQHQQQDTPYVGMTMIPEYPLDFTAFDTNASSWAGNVDLGLYDTQVFAVTSLPQGPAIDEFQLPSLSGKSSEDMGYPATRPELKNEAPSIERMPTAEPVEACAEPIASTDEEEFDESDPAFILYCDSAAPVEFAGVKTEEALFGHIELEKAFGRVELTLGNADDDADAGGVSASAMEKFERLCSCLEELSERVTANTP